MLAPKTLCKYDKFLYKYVNKKKTNKSEEYKK
jgi:hypothetical protein